MIEAVRRAGILGPQGGYNVREVRGALAGHHGVVGLDVERGWPLWGLNTSRDN